MRCVSLCLTPARLSETFGRMGISRKRDTFTFQRAHTFQHTRMHIHAFLRVRI